MRTLLLENTSKSIIYYIPFIRSYDVVKAGFSPEEIQEIRSIISNPKESEDLKQDRSVKITFDRDSLLGGLSTGNSNLSSSIDEIEILTDNENDPVTKEIVDIIYPKINSQININKKILRGDVPNTGASPLSVPTDIKNMAVSANGLDLIKKFEGFRDTPYICPGGMLTIGYGNVIKEGEYTKITKDQAEALLRSTVSSFERTIQKQVKVPLTQNQYDALISFAYNVGSGAFSDSTLLKLLNNKNYNAAAEEFLKWTKSNGKILRGLQRRREEEKELFLS